LVIIGAGASYDLIPYHASAGKDIGYSNAGLRPPLTQDVFRDDDQTREILDDYQGARNLTAMIRLELLRGKQLEPLLLEYSRATTEPLAGEFLEIPLYLQQFFGMLSGFTNQATNYQILAHKLFRSDFDKIVFVTTNYETLLDDVLIPDYFRIRLQNVGAYCQPHCMLIKLHGSVNWVRSFSMDVGTTFNTADGYLDHLRDIGSQELRHILRTEIELRDPKAPPMVWDDPAGPGVMKFYYPALSVPLGEYDLGFSCPDAHVRELKAALPHCKNVLAIGTSARDNDLLMLLTEGLPKPATCFHAVDATADAAYSTVKNFSHVPQLGVHHGLHSEGFSQFILGDGLDQFIESCD